MARYIHAHSARRDRPFVAVNCAEISEDLAPSRFFGHKRGAFTGALTDESGFFRAAHGGMLLLDEVGDLHPRAQAALLRVLENRVVVPVGETREVHVDVAVVLATSVPSLSRPWSANGRGWCVRVCFPFVNGTNREGQYVPLLILNRDEARVLRSSSARRGC